MHGVICFLALSASPLDVRPPAVVIDSPEATVQLAASAAERDVTRQVQYSTRDKQVAIVDENGLVTPRGEGKTEIVVTHSGTTATVPVEVRQWNQPTPIDFEQQILPILTKATCNSGGCHGKAEGQNGFKLSVFGFDPQGDFQSIAMEARGRRIFPTAPDASLFLLKATAQVPHGGGKKIDRDSPRYHRLRRWIAEGAKYTQAERPPIVRVEVEPRERILALGGTQQLRVLAVDAAGGKRCVTSEAEYESNAEPIAAVDRKGYVEASNIPGEAAILVRYLGHVNSCRISLPRPGVTFPRPPEVNFIDRHVWDQLTRLGIPPSELADDSTFLRRVYLDVIGTLPTSAEARAFLADTAPNKRAVLIDRLLERPEHADLWALKWADLLRADKDIITPRGAIALTRWLRQQYLTNRPYDQFVRDIILARGNTGREGPAALYVVLDSPEALARSVAQLFLGVRIACAQCHHHPSDRWGQDDYFALAGFFSGVARKTLPNAATSIYTNAGADLKNPRTNTVIPAHALGAEPPDMTRLSDRRQALADWMTSPDNPHFARAIANRVWSHYFGRGLVEPIDDIRPTNPAANEPLLIELEKHLRDLKYDLRAFTRTLLNSRVYQLSGKTNEHNATDEQNFSHATAKALPAEVLLDAVCQVTGVPEKFNGTPPGYRAIQIWDNRMPSYFFRIFGRPQRASVCECERSNEPSITQALHLMNSEEIADKIRAKSGMARKLAESELSPTQIVEELYLTMLARRPTEREQALMLEAFAGQKPDRRAATEDVLWTLLNAKEFLYNQ